MKRLLSWLLVLAMVFSILPMSAFAVDVETDGDSDMTVDMWELLEGGSEANPLDLTADLMNEGDSTATVTIPAGMTGYYIAYRVGGMNMTINDGEAVACTTQGMMYPYSWSIKNETEAEATYTIKVAFPEGHQQNPKVIESMSWYSDEVAQAEGDNDGYYYIYTAPADGTITLYFNPVYDDEGNVVDLGTQRDIMVTNNTTYAQYSLLADGVDNYGLELIVPVAAGDEIIINTAWVKDADGNYYPEATYSWNGNFAYPAGSEQNPITLEWAWNDEGTTATASATVAAGETVYYTGTAGMILTVDGVETEMTETGVFSITNSGDAEATYALALATPVGAQGNPEVIENIDGYSDTNSLEADASYYYIWTATEDGTVTLDVTDGANLTVDKLTYTEDSEWPISTQYALAEPEIDENWNYTGWTVAENLVIEVVAGEQLKIQVNGLTDWATWTTPAIEYTVTGAFEAAVTGPIEASDLVFQRYALSFQEYTCLQFIVYAKNSPYTNIYAEVTQVGPDGTTTVTMQPEVMGNYRFFNKEMLSWSMSEAVTCTLYGEKDGQLYVGQSYTTSVMEQAIAKIASADDKTKTALVDLLNYGAAVQVNFSRDVENLPNKTLAELGYDVYGTSTTPAMNSSNGSEGTGTIAKSREALSLQAQIQFQIIFKIKDMSAYTAHFVIDGAETVVEADQFVAMGSYTAVPFAFAPYKLRDSFTVVIKDAAGNAVSPVYTYSVEGVATEKFAGNGSNQDNLFIAMMKFADSVSALLG